MSPDFTMFAVAGAAAIASPAGGLIALWFKPSTLFMSLAFGFAGGVLLGTISLEMIPRALEFTSALWVATGFIAGFVAVYAFDLFVNRGRIVGEKAEQRRAVAAYHRRHRPRGDRVTVLAGGTSAEELIEGLTIGVGAVIQPGLALMVALAIVIDNMAEALSVGELIRARRHEKGGRPVWPVLKWTGLIGASLFGAALAGWFLLQGLPKPVIGFLFAAGAGGMFYLSVTSLVPEAEERQYQQSAALAIGMGFITVFILGQLF